MKIVRLCGPKERKCLRDKIRFFRFTAEDRRRINMINKSIASSFIKVTQDEFIRLTGEAHTYIYDPSPIGNYSDVPAIWKI
jgi:hypothetical protein